MHGGYHDIDACPSLTFLIEKRDDPMVAPFLNLAVDRRPAEELFDIRKDPGCLKNLATDQDFSEVRTKLRDRLRQYLLKTGDPRVAADDTGDIFETYPRYSGIRWFPVPEWASEDPDRVPRQPWLEGKRPKAK